MPRLRQTPLGLLGLLLLCTAACGADGLPGPTTTTAGDGDGDAGSAEGGETGNPLPADPPDVDTGLALMPRLSGLWVGPVDSNTSVGDIPTMNIDFRPATDKMLFGRVDLDARNALRMALTVENHGGREQLIFRNGGLFLGLSRDTRTTLVDADTDAGMWRFCAVDRGCEYVDAVFSFDGPDALVMDVDVRGMFHERWTARRVESRSLPDGYPTDRAAGTPDDPFPPMPELAVELSWSTPVTQPTEAWIVLSDTACGITAACNASRHMRTEVAVGATSASLTIPQIHGGRYFANAVLDHNGNFDTTLFPDSGDLLALPDQVVDVAGTGTTGTSLNLLVEL